MRWQRLLDELGRKYALITRTQHHVQIETVHGKHNIYFPDRGPIKFHPCGQQGAHPVTESELIAELEKYEYRNTDLALMQRLSLLIKRVEGKAGIFCDAGYAEGHARVAIVHAFNDGDYDITIRLIEAKDSYQAEDWAIKKAIEMYPGDEPVFSDCEGAVNANQPRARWVSRDANKDADRFGNMRGRK